MVVVIVMVVVVVMMIIVMMVIVMMIMMMVVMMIILSHHHRLLVSGSFAGAALILGAENAPGVRDGVQQFGERASRLQHRAGLVERGSGGGGLNAANKSKRRGGAEQADEGLVQAMSFRAVRDRVPNEDAA